MLGTECRFVLQSQYKHKAEVDRASYTSVIDTPDILHAQQIRNIISQVSDTQPTSIMHLLHLLYGYFKLFVCV